MEYGIDKYGHYEQDGMIHHYAPGGVYERVVYDGVADVFFMCPVFGEVVLYEKQFSITDMFIKDWEVHDAVNAKSGLSGWSVENGQLLQRPNIYRAGGDEYEYYGGTHAALRAGTDWTD